MGSLEYFACGETTHGMHQLLRGATRERRVFPAGAFLYTSGDRRVLFDTGYAPEPWRAGLAGSIYRRLLPPRVPAGATIGEQLDPSTVTHVVLSHLHPDHVGGIQAFPEAHVILTEGLRDTLGSSHHGLSELRAGLLRGLLPSWLDERVTVVGSSCFEPWAQELRAADLFGDGSYRLVDLPGHSRGHVGALVEGRVLLAADAAWGREMLGQEHRIKPVPRAVAHSFAVQTATARSLLAVERTGIRLLFSHDRHPSGVDLLAHA